MASDTITVPETLRYRDGRYRMERANGRPLPTLRSRRVLTRTLRAIHRPWFAVWMPRGVAEITTRGRVSGLPRRTFVRAYRHGQTVYLVSITGEHALWLRNLRADPATALRMRHFETEGRARDVTDAERAIAERYFCGRTMPFDYVENLFHRTGVPSRRRIAELHRAWLEGGTVLVVDISS
ncbi:nitroreductase family deazaflavin-dependent oxidoreductase [Tsukamurella sp. 8F]|uniref:nitroreductase family deazaflavin-dependent oxidoreductase n=1 Tax=unclassified Tsukamurella TaxID=2633480 RepID=UPI0023BA36FE|nr:MULTISPECIES: nitroreductase family deazaflavin-dependent oxidoreductase [unclassified Tsukamurella]MDF0530492.1 nitroreductase family deazaflavin-dependent oxidoreductase [Tsukamurella sp. 8J]MDF0587687.1 nitroreductase family deazaflavin-dependent oxidoreductase [Tsukamurella sp. 8F]